MDVVATITEPGCLAFASIAGCLQGLLWWRFAARRGPFQKDPGFASHQLVALPLELAKAVLGTLAWAHPAGGLTAEDRLHGQDFGGYLTAKLILSAMLWDVVSYLAVPTLCTPVMLIHHVITMTLAALSLSQPFMLHYAGFFFGAVEVSSCFLIIVDLFRPEHFPELADPARGGVFAKVNEMCRYLFALTFLCIRCLYWPWVMGCVFRDVAWALQNDADAAAFVLYSIVGGGIFLTILQFYWGGLIVRQIVKLVKKD
eukprot:TRINITY_DN42353_c0_g1_i1.p1 TRINITY_DN42353_c0_g1~~TRINITY_DN42353_c0_g1_i1.p1  ORF type:complete len:257 (+),score=30.94 TRINITY_DN42353_c0_g1_i1:75-845(+)